MDGRYNLNVMKLKCLWIMCGAIRMVRLRHQEMKRRLAMGEKMSDTLGRKVFK